MVAATASERGAGIDPAAVAVAAPRTGARAVERKRLDRGDSGWQSSPEHNGVLADHRSRGVVQGSAERTHLPDSAGGGANGVNPARRATAGGQPAEHYQPAELGRPRPPRG